MLKGFLRYLLNKGRIANGMANQTCRDYNAYMARRREERHSHNGPPGPTS